VDETTERHLVKANSPTKKSRLRPIHLVLGWALLGAMSSPALCIIGYVNVVITNGYQLLENPLDMDGINSVTNVFRYAPVGTRVWLWNVTNQRFDPPSVLTDAAGGWTLNLLLPPGRGFALHSPAVWTNTFTGSVVPCPGSCRGNFVAGGNTLTLLGSMLPLQGALTNAIFQFTPRDGDTVLQYSKAAQRYLDAGTYYSGFGWYPTEPELAVAESFFLRHPGPDTNWIQCLDPPMSFSVASRAGSVTASEPGPAIESFALRDRNITLKISKTIKPYKVQFSANGQIWTDVAADQTGATWKGPLPPGPTGFFRVVGP